jgi:hypothetical protein
MEDQPDEANESTEEDSPEEIEDDCPQVTFVEESRDQELRNWIKTLGPLLADRHCETDPSPRVQLAFDKMIIAACERISRICQDDLAE